MATDSNGDIDGLPPEDARTSQARDWVVRLSSGEIDEAGMGAFKAWLAADPANRDAFDRERRFWHRLGALDAGRRHGRPANGNRRRGAIATLALAACLAVYIALGGPLPGIGGADFETAQGHQERVTLRDGTVVHLNTDTAFRVDFTEGERRIDLLHGEALFEVSPDKTRPFRVAAGGGVAEAVGTAFAVRTGMPADGGQTRVTVTEGIVRVSSPAAHGASDRPGSSLRLIRGQETVFARGKPPQGAVAADDASALAWRRGLIRIDSLPLDTAVAELDRYLPGRVIVLSGAAGLEKVSGVFDMDKVPAALRGLAATQGLTVTRVTGYLTILH